MRRKALAAEDAMRVAEVAEVADVMRADAERPPGGVTIEPKDVSLADAQRRWADLRRRIYEVAPLLCPTCGGAMGVIALIQEPKVIDKIVRQLRAKGPGRARRPVGDRAAGGRSARPFGRACAGARDGVGNADGSVDARVGGA